MLWKYRILNAQLVAMQVSTVTLEISTDGGLQKKLKIKACDPALPLLSIDPPPQKKTQLAYNSIICISLFDSAVFAISKLWD